MLSAIYQDMRHDHCICISPEVKNRKNFSNNLAQWSLDIPPLTNASESPLQFIKIRDPRVPVQI